MLMEKKSGGLYIAGVEGRENSGHMVLNLKVVEARNVKPTGKRTSMFVRYHLRSGDGKGNNVAVNTREVMANPYPEWKQTFCLKCSGSLCDLQKQFVMFELRQRRKTRILGISMSKSSEVVGWVEIPWTYLLASPTSSINSWFPLICTDTRHVIAESPLPPSLHLSISLGPLSAIDSVSRSPQHNRLRIPRITSTKVAGVILWGVESDPGVKILNRFFRHG